MFRLMIVLVITVTSLSVMGCGMKVSAFYTPAPEAPIVEPVASYKVGKVTFSGDDEDPYDVIETMRASLQSKLESGNPTDKNLHCYMINVDIDTYTRHRPEMTPFLFLLPIGASSSISTHGIIGVTATIMDQDGNDLASVSSRITRSYSLSSTCEDIVDNIVAVVRDSKKRITREEYDLKKQKAFQENLSN